MICRELIGIADLLEIRPQFVYGPGIFQLIKYKTAQSDQRFGNSDVFVG